MRGYGRPYLRFAPPYGYGVPPPWAGGKGKGKGKFKSEEFRTDGASASSPPPVVACRCGNVIKATILRKRPTVLCNYCGSTFPLEGVADAAKLPNVSQSVNAAPWRDADRLARVREAPGAGAAANVGAAFGVGGSPTTKDCLQAELGDVLRFISQVEQKSVANPGLLANLRAEEAAIRERIAAVPAPVLDRSALTRRLTALTGAVNRAENEKKQQVSAFDKELAALNERIEKIVKSEQVLAAAEKEFAEVQAQLAVASPPPGAVPLFATVLQLQEYLVKNPAVVDACLGHPSFVAHFVPAAGVGVKEEVDGAKRSVETAFGVVDLVNVEDDLLRASAAARPPAPRADGDDLPMEAAADTGLLTPGNASDDDHARSRSPVPSLERPISGSSDDAKGQLAESLGSRS
jgi:hypothetical protein